MKGFKVTKIGNKIILQRERKIYNDIGELLNEPDLTNLNKVLQNITEIAPYSFAGTDIEEVNIPDNISFIGFAAFANCKKLKKVTIGNGINQITVGCFDGCTNLEEVNLSEGITHISSHSFEDCKRLVDIKLPSSIKFIGKNAFSNTSIKSLNIPQNAFFAGNIDLDLNFITLQKEDGEYLKQIREDKSLIHTAIKKNSSFAVESELTCITKDNLKEEGIRQ